MKSTLYNTINAEVPKDVDSFEEVPEESNYYYMKTGEKFIFYKDLEKILIQTKLMSKIMYRFSNNVFMDGTFFTAPKLSYQLIVIRAYVAPLKKYFTVAFGLMQNKTKALYIKVLEKIKEHINNNIPQNNRRQIFKINNFHCDFEEGLYKAALEVFPLININFCYWHFHQLMEKKRKTFLPDYVENQEVRDLFKRIITLPAIDNDFINDVFEKIKEDA